MLARVFLSALLTHAAFGASVLSHRWLESKLDLTLDDGIAQIEWVSPTSIRVIRQWSATPSAQLQIKHDPVLVALEDLPAQIRMRTRYITVEINKANSQIQIRTGETPIATMNIDRTAVQLTPIDRVYGLRGGGSKTLDLHGKIIPEATGMMITSNGYGIFLPPSQPVTADFQQNKLNFRANSIELVFYHGPSPKEILEQHLTTTGQSEVTADSLAVLKDDQLPAQASRLPRQKVDSFDALANLVTTLNHWSLSAVLYPALDLSTLDAAPEPVKQRALDLAAILPLVYNAPSPDRATRDAFKPYLTTYLREAHDRGFPLIHSLETQFYRDAGADQQPDLFLLGDELLVAPVFTSSNTRRLKLPRGIWTDLRTNTEYRGNQTIDLEAPPGRVPMLARNGSLFPMAAAGKMELHYFPSLGGEFFLWEPSQEENSQFHAAPAGDYMRVEVETKVRRTYEWVLHHTKRPKEVTEDSGSYTSVQSSTQLRPNTWWHDQERNDLHIQLRAESNTDRILNISF